MLGVIVHWDHKQGLEPIGKRSLLQYYDYTARAFGAEKIVYVDVDNTMHRDKVNSYSKRVFTLQDALKEFPNCTPVYIHPSGDLEISEVSHPENAVYIVGPDFGKFAIPDDAFIVRINMIDDVQGLTLWSHTALGIVLHNRLIWEEGVN